MVDCVDSESFPILSGIVRFAKEIGSSTLPPYGENAVRLVEWLRGYS